MEYLTSFIIWALGVYGMSTIIVNSLIFRPFREFLQFHTIKRDNDGNMTSAIQRGWRFPGKLVTCILCMSFWCGLGVGQFVWNPFQQSEAHPVIQAIFNGCIGSGTTWLIYLWVADKMADK